MGGESEPLEDEQNPLEDEGKRVFGSQGMILNFAIVNFPFLCSNIPLSPAYGVYVSQLIRYARACFACEDFSKRGRLLTNKLMLQGYIKSSFRKFYDRYNDFVCDYKLPLAHMLDDWFHTIG
jgi:hypothetical protein